MQSSVFPIPVSQVEICISTAFNMYDLLEFPIPVSQVEIWISKAFNIYDLLEKQDRKIFDKVLKHQ